MSTQPFNQTWKKQNKKLVPATYKKGFINAIHPQSNTVDVYLAENPNTVIKNIPVAKSVDFADIMVQQKCRIDMFDETNARDAVVAYVW